MNTKNKIILGSLLGAVTVVYGFSVFRNKLRNDSFIKNEDKPSDDNNSKESGVSTLSAPKKVNFANLNVFNLGKEKRNSLIKFYDYTIGINNDSDIVIKSKGKPDLIYKVHSEFGGSDSNNLQRDVKIKIISIWINKNGDVKMISPNKQYEFKRNDIKTLLMGYKDISLDIMNRSFSDILFGSQPYINFNF